MSEKLKPCPFCGAVPERENCFVHISHAVYHKNSCWFYRHGESRVTHILKHSHDKMDARNWNRRAEVSHEQD